MSIIADTSYVYAIYHLEDGNHDEARAFASRNHDEIVVTEVMLPELGYLFMRDLGYPGLIRFLRRFTTVNWRFYNLVLADLERISEISAKYASSRFDVVDCCIMAMAERLDITRIATFDRRDFRIHKPRHCRAFELLP